MLLLGVPCYGCANGASDRPELGQVSGTVTLDGRPVDGARISFLPKSQGRGSAALTRPDGTYTLYYDREEGARVGQHEVKITTFTAAGDGFGGRAEEIPRKYNRNSELVADVKASQQTIDFSLTDDPKEYKWLPSQGRDDD